MTVGFAKGTRVTGNTIAHIPATAISLGWGWGRPGSASFMANNSVFRNRVHDFKRVMHDGGCVYLQGDQPGTVIEANWCSKLGPNSGGGVLYPDEGSGEMVWRRNVVTSTPPKTNWANIWVPSVHEQLFVGNWHDTAKLCNHGTNITIVNDTVINSQHPPDDAWAIMNGSGVSADDDGWPLAPVIPLPPSGPPSPPRPQPPPPGPGPTPCPQSGSASHLAEFHSTANSLGFGPDLASHTTFRCAARSCCAELSAALCDNTTGCVGFALNVRHWFHGLRPQLYMHNTPTSAHHGPGWTFWGKRVAQGRASVATLGS